MMYGLGYKNTHRMLGYVADWCPDCRSNSTVEVHRNGTTLSFYRIPLGQGQFINASGRCTVCRSEFPVELTDYLSVQKKAGDQLVQQTNPRLGDTSGALQQAHERFVAIRAPFIEHASNLNMELFQETRFDRTSVLAFLAAFAAPFLVGYALSFIPKSTVADLMVVNYLILFFLVCFFAAFVVFFRAPRRAVRRHVLPRIATDLQAIEASADEVSEVLNKLKQSGERLCHFIKAPAVMKEIHKT